MPNNNDPLPTRTIDEIRRDLIETRKRGELPEISTSSNMWRKPIPVRSEEDILRDLEKNGPKTKLFEDFDPNARREPLEVNEIMKQVGINGPSQNEEQIKSELKSPHIK